MLTARQMAKTTKTEDGHLLWTGALANGYPAIKRDNRTLYLKRVIWEERNGAIPEGLVVTSTCRVKLCVEPSHLALTGAGRHRWHRMVDGRHTTSGGRDDTR